MTSSRCCWVHETAIERERADLAKIARRLHDKPDSEYWKGQLVASREKVKEHKLTLADHQAGHDQGQEKSENWWALPGHVQCAAIAASSGKRCTRQVGSAVEPYYCPMHKGVAR